MDRETLEYYICSIGEEVTMALFKLTEKQVEKILFGKVQKEGKFTYKEKEYIEFQPSTGKDLEHLERVITKFYSKLYKTHVSKKYNINTRSLTQEDTFQSGLLSILKNAESFTYVSDEDTLRYINKALKHDKINATQQNNVGQRHKAIIEEKTTSGITEEFSIESTIENLFADNKLTKFQVEICNLLIEGFNQTEIAEKLGVTRKTIYNNIQKLSKLINM